MTFTARARYLIITAAVFTASAIQLIRGYKLVIVAVAALTFLATGYLVVYLSGSRVRALRRKQKYDYYAGKS